MAITLFSCAGGLVVLPDAKLTLVSRADGGNLIVNPPREVWERGELTAAELTQWSFLVAATGGAMLSVLPQLENGCINYWEAGNWALNIEAEPKGVRKSGKEHRKVHLHLLGRSRSAQSASWKWGEAPKFPNYAQRFAWAAKHERLTAQECASIMARVETGLREKYGMRASEIAARTACPRCSYPFTATGASITCAECQNAP